MSVDFDLLVRSLCEQAVREAVLESEMDQLENELFSNRLRLRSANTPPLTPPLVMQQEAAPPPYTPPKPQKIVLATPPPIVRRQHQTLCQAICATTLDQFPSLIRNPQLLLSLTVQQTLSVQSMLEAGDYEPEEEADDSDPLVPEALVSPASTMICREQIGYDTPVHYGPLENYSDTQVHYDMIPRVEWNVMIPGLQARPCFLNRVKKIPRHQPTFKTRHEELLARRPAPPTMRDYNMMMQRNSESGLRGEKMMMRMANREEEEHNFIVTTSPASPQTPTRPKLPGKPKKEVTNVKRDLFERIVVLLMQRLPTYTRSAVIKLVRDVREKNGGLSGRSTEDIVRGVLNYERLHRGR